MAIGPEFLVAGDGAETGGVGHEVKEADSVLLFRHFRNDLVEGLVEFQEAPFDQEAGGAGDDGLDSVVKTSRHTYVRCSVPSSPGKSLTEQKER